MGVSAWNLGRIGWHKILFYRPIERVGIRGPSHEPSRLFSAFAGYFVPQSSFDTANLNVLSNAWLANIGDPVARETVCASYVNGIVSQSLGGSETVERYGQVLLPAYAAKMKSLSKYAIMYEGGWDHDIKPVSSTYYVTPSMPFAGGKLDGVSNIITGVSSNYAAALQPGYFVLGYGIPPLTRILSISGSSITLSHQNTTGEINLWPVCCVHTLNRCSCSLLSEAERGQRLRFRSSTCSGRVAVCRQT